MLFAGETSVTKIRMSTSRFDGVDLIMLCSSSAIHSMCTVVQGQERAHEDQQSGGYSLRFRIAHMKVTFLQSVEFVEARLYLKLVKYNPAKWLYLSLTSRCQVIKEL